MHTDIAELSLRELDAVALATNVMVFLGRDTGVEKSDPNIVARPLSKKKCERPLPLTRRRCYKTQLRRISQDGVSTR